MAKETIVRWESERRYYAARLSHDLLGDLTLNLCWGGLRNSLGNISTEPVPSIAEGLQRIEELDKARRRHKYRMVDRREA